MMEFLADLINLFVINLFVININVERVVLWKLIWLNVEKNIFPDFVRERAEIVMNF